MGLVFGKITGYQVMNMSEKFEWIDNIPTGQAGLNITPGCMVLEGGAFRGLYTQGVLDYLMEHDINMQTTIGVSAGAMGGMSYVSGQIGRSARVNLLYRHNQKYVGLGAMAKDHGITGFTFLFGDISKKYPLDEERFNDPEKRFVVEATNVKTGRPVYFERGKCSDIYKAVQASATVPYVSEPVEIDGEKYLDGGVSVKVPYGWAIEEGYEKIVVIRTRDRSYRGDITRQHRILNRAYKDYPEVEQDLLTSNARYNVSLNTLDELEASGRVFVFVPSEPITISRFEGDINALADVYWLGYHDARKNLAALKKYLAR